MKTSRLKNEIAHSKYLAKTGKGKLWYWTTNAGQERLKRRQQIILENVTSNMKVLELGCGPGYFTEILKETKANITSIDISAELLKFAVNRANNHNVVFRLEDIHEMSFENDSFDLVLGNSILHHLDIEEALKEIKRVLNPGGNILFMEPNMLNPQQYLQMHLPILRKMTQHSPDETALTRWGIERILKENEFNDICIKPFDFLHTLTPSTLISVVKNLGLLIEKIPFISEISGSLLITAKLQKRIDITTESSLKTTLENVALTPKNEEALI